eukprot:2207960-Prymnesium_polylepis.1
MSDSLVPVAGIWHRHFGVQFAAADSPEYQAAYHHRYNALDDGKSALITSFPLGGTATEDVESKVPVHQPR